MAQFKMGNGWYSNRHGMSPVNQPMIWYPKNPLKWEGLDLGNVMTAGIYTANQIERVRNQIMYPQERRAISERFAGTLNHDSIMHKKIDYGMFMDTAKIRASFINGVKPGDGSDGWESLALYSFRCI